MTRLITRFPETTPQLQEFPSGSFMIDLYVNGETYVIECVERLGFGLSKQQSATFGWEGAEETFDDADKLLERLEQMAKVEK